MGTSGVNSKMYFALSRGNSIVRSLFMLKKSELSTGADESVMWLGQCVGLGAGFTVQ